MSCTTAVMLQDRLNDIERNIYDGIDFRQELNEAYALADELQAENEKLRKALCAAWKCVHAGISCSDCRLIAGCCTLKSAMRELRIEVD